MSNYEIIMTRCSDWKDELSHYIKNNNVEKVKKIINENMKSSFLFQTRFSIIDFFIKHSEFEYSSSLINTVCTFEADFIKFINIFLDLNQFQYFYQYYLGRNIEIDEFLSERILLYLMEINPVQFYTQFRRFRSNEFSSNFKSRLSEISKIENDGSSYFLEAIAFLKLKENKPEEAIDIYISIKKVNTKIK